MAKKKQSSVLEQLMGAVVGGGLALALYYAYDYSAPVVTAWIIQPSQQTTTQNTIASDDGSGDDVRRVQTQTRKVSGVYAQASQRMEQQHVPVVRPSSSSSLSSFSSVEGKDSIWEQAWTSEQSSSSARSIAIQEPVAPVVTEVAQAPALPSSGIGLWLLVGTAGAYAGSYVRRKSRG